MDDFTLQIRQAGFLLLTLAFLISISQLDAYNLSGSMLSAATQKSIGAQYTDTKTSQPKLGIGDKLAGDIQNPSRTPAQKEASINALVSLAKIAPEDSGTIDALGAELKNPNTAPERKAAIIKALSILASNEGPVDLSGDGTDYKYGSEGERSLNAVGLSGGLTNTSNMGAGISVDAGGSGAHPSFETKYGTDDSTSQQSYTDRTSTSFTITSNFGRTMAEQARYDASGNKYGLKPNGFGSYLFPKGTTQPNAPKKNPGSLGSDIQKSSSATSNTGVSGSSGSGSVSAGNQKSNGIKSTSPAPGSGVSNSTYTASNEPKTSKSPQGTVNSAPVDAKTSKSTTSSGGTGGNAGGASSNSNAGSSAGGTSGAHVGPNGMGGNTGTNTGGSGPGGTGSTPQ